MDNEPRERLPQVKPDAEPAPKGNASRMKSELAGLTLEEQKARVKPPEPKRETPKPVQKASPVQLKVGDVVQMGPVKTHTDISTQIKEAEMGPYLYVPEAHKFILKVGSLDAEKLWDACLDSTNYGPETATVPNVAKADKTKRIKAAKKKLLGSKSDAVFKKIIAHDDGKSPRAFSSVADEPSENSHAHCHDRHVFGMGTINGVTALAIRAAFRRPFAPGDDGIASAFTNVSAANTYVSKAIKDKIEADWKTVRVKIAKGSNIDPIMVSASGNITGLQKKDSPVGTAYDESEMPNYRGGDGYRPLYPGEPMWENNKLAADDSERPKYSDANKNNPLTVDATAQLKKIKVILLVDEGASGGWFVLTAYPVVS